MSRRQVQVAIDANGGSEYSPMPRSYGDFIERPLLLKFLPVVADATASYFEMIR